MSKYISDLNEAKAARAAKSAQVSKPAPHRQRLAERLVELAPLAKAPLALESEADDADGLSRLTRDPLTGRHIPSASAGQPTALVPLEPASLPKLREPVRLSPVGVTSPVRYGYDDEFPTEVRQRVTGFLVGLAIASAIGLGLYAVLA